MTTFVVKGRSIDGTVYHTGQGGWTGTAGHAFYYACREDAERVIALRREANAMCDPDDMIGRLEIVEKA